MRRILVPLAVAAAAVALAAPEFAAQRAQARRTWVIPHVLEKSGRISSTPNTFDTDLHMVSLGRAGQVEVFVYDDAGQPLASRSGQAVCNPCRVDFAGRAKQVLSLEERIEAAGGFARPVMTGYMVITAGGEVAMQAFVVNSHTGPFDLSVFGFQPEEVRAPAQ